MADQLKPCPFCGSAAEEVSLYFEGTVNNSCDWFVRCHVCFVESGRTESDVTAIAAWNTRANTPESSAAQGAMDTAIADTVLRFIDRMDDVDPVDPADKIVAEFVAAVMPHIDARIQCKRSDATAQPSHLRSFLDEADKAGITHLPIQFDDAPRVDLTDERAAFEMHMEKEFFRDLQELTYDENGEYDDCDVQAQWQTWRARAALANTAQGKTDDKERLDFVIENTAFTVESFNDAGGISHQLFTQNEDEEYECLHDRNRFYASAVEAIDAALAAKKG